MSEKRLNNTIFLMFLVTENYCKKNNISKQEFIELDKKYDNISCDEAYRKLLSTDLYELLLDYETRLYLEKNEYLFEAYDLEIQKGKDYMYEFINADYLE